MDSDDDLPTTIITTTTTTTTTTSSMTLDQQPQRWMDSPFPMCSSAAPATNTASIRSSTGQQQPSHLDRAGQLSPISTSMDVIMAAADGSCPPSSATSAPAMVHSASSTSSCADSWSMGFGDSDDLSAGESAPDIDVDVDVDPHWEPGSDDILTVPKPEPLDDDYLCLDDVKEAPSTPQASSGGSSSSAAASGGMPKVKRPRGRPRKHPLAANCAANKVTKGRSKTGCITCRKRKKKCDEAKPRCMNCEKNAVVCEGYPEKQIWKSGKEKAEEARLHTSIPTVTMQPIFDGLETLEDRIFWKHYNDHLSTVLTVESEHRNAFKEMLIPIATRDQGLMHSILSLSSIHLDFDTPYGINVLKRNPKTSVAALRERSNHHRRRAMDALQSRNPTSEVSLSAMYGQMMCLILESVAEGRSDDQHRLHLKMYRNLIRESPPQNPAFRAFITEFFQYHIFADELLRQHCVGESPDLPDDVSCSALGDSADPPRLLGVVDGLFEHLCQITRIRNGIRRNIEVQADPLVSYPSLYLADDIAQAIADWEPRWPRGDSRELVAPLYKQMMWVYLYRSVYPPTPPSPPSSISSSIISTTASSAASLPSNGTHMSRLPNSCSTAGSSSLVNTPPKSPSSSCSSSPELRPHTAATWPPQDHDLPPPYSPRRHSVAHPIPSLGDTSAPPSFTPIDTLAAVQPKRSGSLSSSLETLQQQQTQSHFYRQGFPQQQHQQQHQHQHQHQQQRAESPPPIRQPCNQSPRVKLAVEQSLMIIDSLKPADPAQTLLLIPCLVVGTACFAPSQQDRIRAAVRTVRGYTGLRNADRVLELLEEVWRLMAEGDWLAVWDWQGVASRMGLDFLCA